MKYIIVLGDGMADRPIEELGNKTPMEYAKTPFMDSLAQKGELGLVHTIPEGMKPGSDTANLSVIGYDPKKYYSGRSPLEALSIPRAREGYRSPQFRLYHNRKEEKARCRIAPFFRFSCAPAYVRDISPFLLFQKAFPSN